MVKIFLIYLFLYKSFPRRIHFTLQLYPVHYLIIPCPCLLRNRWEKNQWNSTKRLDFKRAFKLARNTIFEQTYNFYAIICFCFYSGDNQSAKRKSNFILFCIFNYVTYINSHPLNASIGKFGSSRRKPSY